MRVLCAQDNFPAKKTLTKLYSSSAQRSITWPLIWFCALLLTCCSPTSSGFRRKPSEMSSSSWLDGGLPTAAYHSAAEHARWVGGPASTGLGAAHRHQFLLSLWLHSREALPGLGPAAFLWGHHRWSSHLQCTLGGGLFLVYYTEIWVGSDKT